MPNLINQIFLTTFTTANDGPQIVKMIQGLSALGPRIFEDSIQETDAIVFIQGSINGVDFITIDQSCFPYNQENDQITTQNGSVFTLTERIV